MKKDSDSERRSLLKWLMSFGVLIWLNSVLYPVGRYIVPPKIPEANISSLQIGTVADFEVSTGSIFQFGRIPGIIVRVKEDEYIAFSATCSHLSCIVQYREDLNQIWCACHNGIFDLSGKNVSGPPPKPLDEFDVHVRGDEVWVSKKA